MQLSELQQTIGFLIALCTFAAGAIAYWRSSVEKTYAAQRDFQHLRRNQEQIGNALADIAKEQDEAFHDVNLELVQIKSLLMAILAKSGDSISSILKK